MCALKNLIAKLCINFNLANALEASIFELKTCQEAAADVQFLLVDVNVFLGLGEKRKYLMTIPIIMFDKTVI